MLFCRTLPGVVLGAFTGTLASRYKRKFVLLLGLSAAAINALFLVVFVWLDELNLFVIGVGAVIAGIVWTLEHPVRRTLVGDVAGSGLLRQAMSLDQLTVNGTRLLGPLVGGATYAALGMSGIYLISLCGFLVAVLLVHSTTLNPPVVAGAGESYASSLVQGLRYIRTHRVLRGVLLFTIIANFFGFSYVTMIPVIGREQLALNPAGIGLLQSMEGAGAVVAALVLSATTRSIRFARSFTLGGCVFMLLLVLFALSP